MQNNTAYRFMMVLVILATLTLNAYSNGRQPGVQVSDVPVKAVCEDATGSKHHLARAKIDAEGGDKLFLNARLGAANAEIPLARIKEITLPDGMSDREGFAKASVLFEDHTRESYMLKVQEGEKAFQLTGYTTQGSILRIPVAQCRKIEFSPLARTPESPEARPVPKY